LHQTNNNKTKKPPRDLDSGGKNHHWKHNQGDKNYPHPRRLGDKTSAERGRREASPSGEKQTHTEVSLSKSFKYFDEYFDY
jgi:hypothetical protein